MLCFYDRSNKNANIEQKGERKWQKKNQGKRGEQTEIP